MANENNEYPSPALRARILKSVAANAASYGEQGATNIVTFVAKAMRHAFGEAACQTDKRLLPFADAAVMTAMINAGSEYLVSAALGRFRDIINDGYLAGLLTFDEAHEQVSKAFDDALQAMAELAEHKLCIAINSDLREDGQPEFFGDDAEEAARVRERQAKEQFDAMMAGCSGKKGA